MKEQSRFLFSHNGNYVQLLDSNSSIPAKSLEPAIYRIEETPKNEVYLLRLCDKFNTPPQRYGGLDALASMLYQNYEEREGSSGAILVGAKGSGKSCLSEIIANRIIQDKQYPVILVDKPMKTSVLIDTIPKLGPCLVIIDEFGKNFITQRGASNSQESLLALFSSSQLKKVMFIIAENEHHTLSQYLKARPDRFQFFIEFKSMGTDALLEIYENLYHEPMPAEHKKFIDFQFKLWQHLSIDYGIDTLKTLAMLIYRFKDNLSSFIRQLSFYNVPPLHRVTFVAKTKIKKDQLFELSYVLRERNKDGYVISLDDTPALTVAEDQVRDKFIQSLSETSFNINNNSPSDITFELPHLTEASITASINSYTRPWEIGSYSSVDHEQVINNFNSVLFYSTVKVSKPAMDGRPHQYWPQRRPSSDEGFPE